MRDRGARGTWSSMGDWPLGGLDGPGAGNGGPRSGGSMLALIDADGGPRADGRASCGGGALGTDCRPCSALCAAKASRCCSWRAICGRATSQRCPRGRRGASQSLGTKPGTRVVRRPALPRRCQSRPTRAARRARRLRRARPARASPIQARSPRRPASTHSSDLHAAAESVRRQGARRSVGHRRAVEQRTRRASGTRRDREARVGRGDASRVRVTL